MTKSETSKQSGNTKSNDQNSLIEQVLGISNWNF